MLNTCQNVELMWKLLQSLVQSSSNCITLVLMSLSWFLSFCPNMFSLTLPMLCRDVSANRYGWSNLWGASWLHPDLQLASGCFPCFSRCFIVCCFYLLDLIALELCNSLGWCRCFKLFCVWPLLFPSIPVSLDWAQINLRVLQAVVLCIFRAGVFSGDLEEATFMFGYSVRTLDCSYVVFVLSGACNLEKENAGL